MTEALELAETSVRKWKPKRFDELSLVLLVPPLAVQIYDDLLKLEMQALQDLKARSSS